MERKQLSPEQTSEQVTLHNVHFVRQQIGHKLNYNTPYYATADTVGHSETDMDHFPYKRFFRGEYSDRNPIVLDREAGYRKRIDACYRDLSITEPSYHEFCWQYPCSMLFPCNAPPPKPQQCRTCNNEFNISP